MKTNLILFTTFALFLFFQVVRVLPEQLQRNGEGEIARTVILILAGFILFVIVLYLLKQLFSTKNKKP